jgi:hypothetical protein
MKRRLSSSATFASKWAIPVFFVLMGVEAWCGVAPVAIKLGFSLGAFTISWLYLAWTRLFVSCSYKNGRFEIFDGFSRMAIPGEYLHSVTPRRRGHGSYLELTFLEPRRASRTIRIWPPGIFSLAQFESTNSFLQSLLRHRNDADAPDGGTVGGKGD